MALYESEHTKFMREMMAKNPQWEEGQREGRAIFWEQKTTATDQTANKASREAHRSYPYDVNFDQQ